MAITVNLLDSGFADAVTGITTASVAPSANALQLFAMNNRRGDSINVGGPTSMVGNGLTFVQVALNAWDTGGSGRQSVMVYRALVASPSAGTCVVSFGATISGVTWSWVEFTGVDTGGSNGSAAVVQSDATVTGAGVSGIDTLAAFASTDNYAYGAVGGFGLGTFTPGSGFTQAHSRVATDSATLFTEYKQNDETVDGSWDGSNAWGMIAAEIKAGSVVSGDHRHHRHQPVVRKQAVARASRW